MHHLRPLHSVFRQIPSRAFGFGGQPARFPAFLIFTLFLMGAQAAKAQGPVEAAETFLQTLSAEEAAAAVAAFEDADRLAIRFTPGPRGGLPLKAMDAETRDAAVRFLEATLSAEGTEMVAFIRQREEILGRMTGNPDYRDPDLYYLAMFGNPGDGTWGYRFEGHHLSINMTYRGDRLVSGVPIMLASNPEKTSAANAPPELLGPMVEDARIAVTDPDARRRLIDALTAHIPGQLRDSYRADLSARNAFSEFDDTWRGFDLRGGETELEIETNQTNHIHITFRDQIQDFGGIR